MSLGYFDTLMSASAASTSSELSETELAVAGQSQGVATELVLVSLFSGWEAPGKPQFSCPKEACGRQVCRARQQARGARPTQRRPASPQPPLLSGLPGRCQPPPAAPY